MFYTEQLRFDITVPIYPLLMMLALACYFGLQSYRSGQRSFALLSAFVVVWTIEIFIARDLWLFGWPIVLIEQNLFKNAVFDSLLGPLLLLAVLLTFNKAEKFKLWHLLLFIPAIAYALNMATVLSLSGHERIALYQGVTPQQVSGPQLWLFTGLKAFQWHTLLLGGCCFVATVILAKKQRWRTNQLKTRFLLLFTLYLCWYTAIQTGVSIDYWRVSIMIEGPEHLTWIALISTLLIFFLQRSQLQPVRDEVPVPSTEKYLTSSLDATMAEQIYQQLVTVMAEKKLYLDDTLNLGTLANELRITTHQLSQTINQMAQRNFFDFVNGYRIDSAQEKLRNKKNGHLSVSVIGEQVGFKSKSAFYAAFKKHVGCTPAEYRKSATL